MANVHLLIFCDLAETTQAACAKTIKDEMEQRTGLRTQPVSEWVRVLRLGNAQLELDLASRRMNIEPASKRVLEVLTRQYLLVGVQQGGPADG